MFSQFFSNHIFVNHDNNNDKFHDNNNDKF